jgi:hypothetical protein
MPAPEGAVLEADDFIIGFEHHIPERRRAAQYG